MKMRVKAKYHILIIIPFLFACSEKPENKNNYSDPEIIESSISEETSIENVKSLPCYYVNSRAKQKCDSTLILTFSIQNFNRNIKWNEDHSFINCDVNESVELMKFGDSMCCNPRTFDLVYDIQIGVNPIYQFRMSAGPDEVFEPVSPIVAGQLAAYRKLIDGEFKIDHNRVNQIARENGYSGKDMTIELFYDGKGDINSITSFYWRVDAHKTDDSREVLQIDPNSGNVETISLELVTIACA